MPIGLHFPQDCLKDSNRKIVWLSSSNGGNTQLLSQNTAVGYHDLKTEFSFLVTKNPHAQVITPSLRNCWKGIRERNKQMIKNFLAIC